MLKRKEKRLNLDISLVPTLKIIKACDKNIFYFLVDIF